VRRGPHERKLHVKLLRCTRSKPRTLCIANEAPKRHVTVKRLRTILENAEGSYLSS
jgi:hypothetical protein